MVEFKAKEIENGLMVTAFSIPKELINNGGLNGGLNEGVNEGVNGGLNKNSEKLFFETAPKTAPKIPAIFEGVLLKSKDFPFRDKLKGIN